MSVTHNQKSRTAFHSAAFLIYTIDRFTIFIFIINLRITYNRIWISNFIIISLTKTLRPTDYETIFTIYGSLSRIGSMRQK